MLHISICSIIYVMSMYMHSNAKLFILGLQYGDCNNLLSNLGIHQGIGHQKTVVIQHLSTEKEGFVSPKTFFLCVLMIGDSR